MKTRVVSLMAVALIVALVAAGSGLQGPVKAVAQAPTTLKAQASFPPTSLLFTNFKVFAERVEKMSGGRLKIETLPPGAVVGAFEVADAVNRGVLDAAHTCTYYFIGKHKAAALFTDVPGGPFGMDVIDFWGWEYEGGGVELLNDFYQNVLKMKIVAFPIFPTTAQSLGWFKKPIKSLKDMKGLKYRVPGLAAEVYKEIGVAVVTLPGGEVLPAGERGVLDATEWYTPGEDIQLGFHNVWKYYYYPGMHETAGACDFLVNKDVWDKLPPELQAIMRGAAFEAAMRSLLQFNRRDAEALRDFREKHKVNLVKTPDDILIAYLKAWDQIAEKESAKDPFFKKVIDSQRAYAALVVPSRIFMNPYDIARRHYWREKAPVTTVAAKTPEPAAPKPAEKPAAAPAASKPEAPKPTATVKVDVKAVQQALKDKGLDPGPIDGQMGGKTRTALMKFQQAQGLKATGAPDPETLAKLGVK